MECPNSSLNDLLEAENRSLKVELEACRVALRDYSMVDVRTCCRCGKEYPDYSIMSTMSCWDCRANDVYSERNAVVAALSRLYPSSLSLDPAIYEPNRHLWPVVTINSPAGQLSWHIAEKDLHYFTHLEWETNQWDGHTTEEKYERLKRIADVPGA